MRVEADAGHQQKPAVAEQSDVDRLTLAFLDLIRSENRIVDAEMSAEQIFGSQRKRTDGKIGIPVDDVADGAVAAGCDDASQGVAFFWLPQHAVKAVSRAEQARVEISTLQFPYQNPELRSSATAAGARVSLNGDPALDHETSSSTSSRE